MLFYPSREENVRFLFPVEKLLIIYEPPDAYNYFERSQRK